MMNKKRLSLLNETLSKAISPPKKPEKTQLDELLRPYHVVEDKPVTPGSITENERETTLTRQSRQSSQTGQITSVAPEKDFQKVANSISKSAVPSGLFRGKSKQLYDALYSLTRGAIKPVRSVRVTKSKLMKLANIGSRITFDSNILHLAAAGLIKETVFAGEHQGNEFEVFIPEECLPRQSNQSSQTSYAQKLDRLVILETRQTSQSAKAINIEGLAMPKTSLKTREKNDDELTRRISAKLRETHGRELTAKEKGKMDLIRDAVAEMLGTAFGKAETISDAVSFALEHLHRLDARPRVVQSLPLRKKDEVGRHDFDREAELVIWRDILADGGVVEDFEQYRESYAVEDWQWLMSEIVR